MVKNPPVMRETWVWSLGWEDPLEKPMATHSRILCWGPNESDMTEWLSTQHRHWILVCAQSCSLVWLSTTYQAPLSLEFSRQEYWRGLPFPSPGDLPDPGIEPESSVSTALAGRFFTTESPGKPTWMLVSPSDSYVKALRKWDCARKWGIWKVNRFRWGHDGGDTMMGFVS